MFRPKTTGSGSDENNRTRIRNPRNNRNKTLIGHYCFLQLQLMCAWCRKSQQEFEESEERAKMADSSLHTIRMSRGGSILVSRAENILSSVESGVKLLIETDLDNLDKREIKLLFMDS